MSQDLHTTRVAAGYKAALNNDNVSAEAKANAARRLEELGADGSAPAVQHENRVLGGYKATLSSESLFCPMVPL